MLRSCLLSAPLLLVAVVTLGCSEGTETGDGMLAAADDDAPAADDDAPAADDDAPAADDDAPAADDDAPAADDDAPAADDDAPAPAEAETLIDVTTAMRDMASYDTEKEFLTETAVLEVSEDEGDPAPSLRIELPFTNYNQFIEFQYLADQVNGGAYWDLEDKVLSLRLKVEQQGYSNPDCPGGVRFFVKTGENYDYAGRSWYSTPEASDAWLTIDFDLSAAEPGEGLEFDDLDLSDVRAIGFGFESADCGGVYPAKEPPPETDAPSTAVFYMDDITVRRAGL